MAETDSLLDNINEVEASSGEEALTLSVCCRYPRFRFAVGTGNSTTVFNEISIAKPKERKKVAVHLNTALDVSPIVPVLTKFGLWLLEYEFYAIEFPLLSVEIELALQPGKSPEVKIVSQNSA